MILMILMIVTVLMRVIIMIIFICICLINFHSHDDSGNDDDDDNDCDDDDGDDDDIPHHQRGEHFDGSPVADSQRLGRRRRHRHLEPSPLGCLHRFSTINTTIIITTI